MAKLKRDERVCPYCAETIKAAATRCRYCQSDLTPLVEAEPETAIEAEPETVVESSVPPQPQPPPPPEPSVAAEESAGPSRQLLPSLQGARSFVERNLTLVLAALVLLAGAGVGVAWYRAEQGSSAVAPSGSLVGDDARTEVLVAAADLTQRTLSYDYKTLANDMEVARARMTP
ncbi:MAG: hypothetical protein WB409_00455, partial [Aeromicrobium sp.]